jgi:hypothetical protein
MRPASPVTAECASCHTSHHEGAADCSGCHSGYDIRAAHAELADAHGACAACHDPKSVNLLEPGRTFCLACHEEARAHAASVAGECTVCHFLVEPAVFRPRIARGLP